MKFHSRVPEEPRFKGVRSPSFSNPHFSSSKALSLIHRATGRLLQSLPIFSSFRGETLGRDTPPGSLPERFRHGTILFRLSPPQRTYSRAEVLLRQPEPPAKDFPDILFTSRLLPTSLSLLPRSPLNDNRVINAAYRAEPAAPEIRLTPPQTNPSALTLPATVSSLLYLFLCFPAKLNCNLFQPTRRQICPRFLLSIYKIRTSRRPLKHDFPYRIFEPWIRRT